MILTNKQLYNEKGSAHTAEPFVFSIFETL